MKNKLLFLILLIVLFSLSPNYALADMGPKPSADIHVTYMSEEILNETFYARMLHCNYKMKYEQIIKELAPYESSGDWINRCDETAPKYNLSKNICYELQNQRGMTDVLKESRCNEDGYNERDPFCAKMVQKIPDYDKGCYWTVARFAWTSPCQNSTCSFHYSPPSEFRLEVYLPSQDKMFLSAPVKNDNFRSSFEANILSDGNITIHETTSFVKSNSASYIKIFILALIITLAIELLMAKTFLSIEKLPKNILWSVLFANLISLPIVWFAFPALVKLPLTIFLAEIFAFIFEAYFIYLLNKKLITLKKSLKMSFVMNLASLFLGGIIFYFMIIFTMLSGSSFFF